jgi:enediyne biosynthesis protein E4
MLALVCTANAAEGVNATALPIPVTGKPGFTEILPAESGIRFAGGTGPSPKEQTRFADNMGLASGDIDGDGRPDLFLCGGGSPCVLYRNKGGWTFEDVTAQAGVARAGRWSAGAAFADVDGDGDLDLFVFSPRSDNSLFLNDGTGRFTEAKDFPWRILPVSGELSGALADIDGDGDLDLYVTSYRRVTAMDVMTGEEFDRIAEAEVRKVRAGMPASPEFLEQFSFITNRHDGQVTLDLEENGIRDVLYVNEGGGKFRQATDADGFFRDETGRPMQLPPDWGLVPVFRDLNDDGAPDLYVCNDFWTPDRVWLNDGKGVFRPAPSLMLRHTSLFCMGVDFGDLDRDGHMDFIAVDMLAREHATRRRQSPMGRTLPMITGGVPDRPQFMQNTLFAGRGDGTWTEIGQFANVAASDWSWSPILLDVDLDGYEDILITSGMERDYMDTDTSARVALMGRLSVEQSRQTRLLYPPYATRNVIFHNRRGFQFEEVGAEWGFSRAAVSGGMTVADFDGDGDLDIAIANKGSPPELYRNESGAPRVAVRLAGRSPNTQGIGARVTLHGGAVPVQTQEVIAGGVYTSGSDPLRVFACGTNTSGMALEVRWRDGTRSVVTNIQANHLYHVAQADTAQPFTPEPEEVPAPFFTDESGRLGHTHTESPFDDWGRQPLLPQRLSQLGPALAWHDADGDGHEDLLVGTGKGGRTAVYTSDGQGTFTRHDSPVVGLDQTGLVGSPWGILVGLASYEWSGEPLPGVQGFAFQEGRRWQLDAGVPAGEGSTGPLALSDLDRDGTLELLVGERVVPGKYPRGNGVRVYRRVPEGWQLDEVNTATLRVAGMVSALACGDLNGDGWPEVVTAGEWGPVRVFTNAQGRLAEGNPAIRTPPFATRNQEPGTRNQEHRLSAWTGLWTGVALGDFDGDGRLDVVAGNRGLNTQHEHTYDWERPLRMYHGDVDGNGTVDLIESYYLKERGAYVPVRDWGTVQRAIPTLAGHIQSFRQYGQSTVASLLGEGLARMTIAEARVLAHMVFLNRGDHWEAQPLPVEAQWSVVYGLGVGDFDGDGYEDLVVSQNDFGVPVEVVRQDGGRGLWLKGKGDGTFATVPGQTSGIAVYGEGRAVAVADWDGDGRLDVAIGQNGAATKLYRNARGEPGLRVRLGGPAGNPTGVGAVLRLQSGETPGPARVITAGSGYWSQAGAVTVLPRPAEVPPGQPLTLHIHWPHQPATQTQLPANTREIRISPDNRIEFSR